MFWFYLRVLRRVPGVVFNGAAVFGTLLFLAAAAALFFEGKTLASDILGLHGFSPVWAIVPIALILTYGLAKANYEEAKQLARPTNRTAQPDSPTTVVVPAGATVVAMPGSNVVQVPPPALPASPAPKAETAPGPQQ